VDHAVVVAAGICEASQEAMLDALMSEQTVTACPLGQAASGFTTPRIRS
jgi:hypothetical protein